MRLIDLTHTFGSQMPVYPGDPSPELKQIAQIPKEGFTDHELKTAMHVGTHMDAPLHMIEGGKYLSQIPIEKFFGTGHLIDARGKKEVGDELLERESIGKSDIVLVMTGWYKKFGEEDYYQSYPELTESFAQELVKSGVSIVGMDTPSPDRPPFAVHKILLGNGILIIENLTNLETLLNVPHFDVIALPAKFHTDAGPVRVIAKAPLQG